MNIKGQIVPDMTGFLEASLQSFQNISDLVSGWFSIASNSLRFAYVYLVSTFINTSVCTTLLDFFFLAVKSCLCLNTDPDMFFVSEFCVQTSPIFPAISHSRPSVTLYFDDILWGKNSKPSCFTLASSSL